MPKKKYDQFNNKIDIFNNINIDIDKIICIDEEILKDSSEKKNIFYDNEEININESTNDFDYYETNYENKEEKKNKNTKISNDNTNYNTNNLVENNENDDILYLNNNNDIMDFDNIII